MHPLFPFRQNMLKLSVTGSVERRGTRSLVITYEITDPRGVLRGGPHGLCEVSGDALVRAHELWKDTCFEFFWSEPGLTSYYECNVESGGKWNVYFFDTYRHPMPPQETDQYDVTRIRSSEGQVQVFLEAKTPIPATLECSFTAVLMTQEGAQFYAGKHGGRDPDFHIRTTLCIEA